MATFTIPTPRLDLLLQTPEEVLAWVEALPPEVRAEVSPDWIARVRVTPAGDPWSFMFSARVRETAEVVGVCGFKGPPDGDGVVEVAYGIDPPHQGCGYATEATGELVRFALADARVQRVRAHTKPDNVASKRVLERNGFGYVGEVIDPEDGLVARWELEQGEGAARY